MSDLFTWPPPASDGEIVWLEQKAERPTAPAEAVEPVRDVVAARDSRPSSSLVSHTEGSDDFFTSSRTFADFDQRLQDAAPPLTALSSGEEYGAREELVAEDADLVESALRDFAPPRNPDDPLSLSRVLISGASFDWNDAVAIVQQLADQLTHDPERQSGSIPPIDEIELEQSGRLIVQLDPSGTVPLVRGLGYLLNRLLVDAPGPGNLRLIVSQAVSDAPTISSIGALMRALASFEGMRRLETLARLHERAYEALSAPPSLVPAGLTLMTEAEPSVVPESSLVETKTEKPSRSWFPRGNLGSEASLLLAVSPRLAAVAAIAVACLAFVLSAREAVRGDTGPANVPETLSAPDARQPLAAGSRGEAAVPETVDSEPRAVGRETYRESMTNRLTSRAPSSLPSARSVRAPTLRGESVARSPAEARVSRSSAEARVSRSPAGARASAPFVAGDDDPSPSRPAISTAGSVPSVAASNAPLTPAAVDAGMAPILRPESAEDVFQKARAHFDRREYAQAAEGFQKVLRILRNGGGTSSATSELRTLAVDFETLSRVALAQRADSPIYTSADEGVTEPVPVRPYLAERALTGMPEGTVAVLELLVDSRGAVESVHLRSPNNNYRDRWWVSVAKNWQFRPAIKDGQPVKFLKRIVISDASIGDPQ